MDLEITKKTLEENHILPRLSLGQNFLVSKEIIKKSVEISNISDQDIVIEIGPGLGSLTSEILKTGAKVFAFEIDQNMVSILRNKFLNTENFILFHQDILKADFHKQIFNDDYKFFCGKKIKIVANLPYYISAEIIEKLICELPFSASMTIMLQKEAIERITLEHGDSRYGPTAILLKLYGKIQKRIKVPAHCFYPRPKVSSQVIMVERYSDSVLLSNQIEHQMQEAINFKKFLEDCFAQRRKTLRNNLRNNVKLKLDTEQVEEVTAKIGIDLSSRPEQITAKSFWKLFQSVANYIR